MEINRQNCIGLLAGTLFAAVTVSSLAEDSAALAKLSAADLAGAIFDNPSTLVIESENEDEGEGGPILDFTSLKASDGKFASGVYKAGPQVFEIDEPYGVDEFMFFFGGERNADPHGRRPRHHQCRGSGDDPQRVARALGIRRLSQDLGNLFC